MITMSGAAGQCAIRDQSIRFHDVLLAALSLRARPSALQWHCSKGALLCRNLRLFGF